MRKNIYLHYFHQDQTRTQHRTSSHLDSSVNTEIFRSCMERSAKEMPTLYFDVINQKHGKIIKLTNLFNKSYYTVSENE